MTGPAQTDWAHFVNDLFDASADSVKRAERRTARAAGATTVAR